MTESQTDTTDESNEQECREPQEVFECRCPMCHTSIEIPVDVSWKLVDCQNCGASFDYVRGVPKAGSFRAKANVYLQIFVVAVFFIGVAISAVVEIIQHEEASVLKKTVVLTLMTVGTFAVFYSCGKCKQCGKAWAMKRSEVAEFGREKRVTYRCRKCGHEQVHWTEYTPGGS